MRFRLHLILCFHVSCGALSRLHAHDLTCPFQRRGYLLMTCACRNTKKGFCGLWSVPLCVHVAGVFIFQDYKCVLICSCKFQSCGVKSAIAFSSRTFFRAEVGMASESDEFPNRFGSKLSLSLFVDIMVLYAAGREEKSCTQCEKRSIDMRRVV